MADVLRTERARGEAAATVYAFAWVPAFAQGVVRDLRVRWALEEPASPTRAG